MSADVVHKYVFNVEMTCEGCSGAVERVLNRLKGTTVKEFTVSLPDQKVTVSSSLSKDNLQEILAKTGKATTFLSMETQ